MSPYQKAALFAIRLIAAGLIILSLCFYSTDLFLFLSHRPIRFGVVFVLKGLPLLAGLILSWKSTNLARELTKDLD